MAEMTNKQKQAAGLVGGVIDGKKYGAKGFQAAQAQKATASIPPGPLSISGNDTINKSTTNQSTEHAPLDMEEGSGNGSDEGFRSTGDPALDQYYKNRMKNDPAYADKILNNQTSSSKSMEIPLTGTPVDTGMTTQSGVPSMNEPMAETMATPASEVGAEPGGTSLPETQAEMPPPKSYMESLGYHKQYVEDKIKAFEQATGKTVLVDNPDFQQRFSASLSNQNRWEDIFDKFSYDASVAGRAPIESDKGWGKPPDSGDWIATTKQPGTQNTGIKNELAREPLETVNKQKIKDAVQEESSKSYETSLSELMTGGMDMTGEGLLKASLLMRLQAIEDPYVTEILDRMELRSKNAFVTALGMTDKSMDEVDAVISGLVIDPETYEGLLSKIYKEGRDLDLQNIETTKDYLNQKNNLIIQDLQNKRADMAGYAKAKLYAMGAQDSSAGVTLVSKVLAEADLQITLAQIENNYQQAQLSLEGSRIIKDFTNKIAGVVLDIQGKEDAALVTYQDKLDEIDIQRLTNESDKRKLKLEAFGSYMDNLAKFQQEQKSIELKESELAFNQAKELADQAYKLSGLMGTLFVNDPETGIPVDTGIPTMTARNYEFDKRAQFALKAWEVMGSKASSTVESLYGLQPGTLAGATVEEQRMYIDNQIAIDQLNMDIAEYNRGISSNQAFADMLGIPYEGQGMLGYSSISPTGEYQGISQNVLAGAQEYLTSRKWVDDFNNYGILQGGELGCAWAVSGALVEAGVLQKNIAAIKDLVPALVNEGWTKTTAPQPGDVVVWSAIPSTQGHKHIGIVTAENKAWNNTGSAGPKVTSISGRPVEAYYTPPKTVKVPLSANDDVKAAATNTAMGAFALGQIMGNTMRGKFGNSLFGNLQQSNFGDPSAYNDYWSKLSAAMGATQTSQQVNGVNYIQFSPQQEFLYEKYWSDPSYRTNLMSTAENETQKALLNAGAMQWALQNPDKIETTTISDADRTQFNSISSSYAGSKLVTDFYTQSSFFRNAVEARKDTSGASDIALVFSFMKVLDPTSVVRETEYATAQNAAGVPSSVRGEWNKIVGGGLLSSTARDQMFKEVVKYYNSAAKSYIDWANYNDQRIINEIGSGFPGRVFRQEIITVPDELMTTTGAIGVSNINQPTAGGTPYWGF